MKPPAIEETIYQLKNLKKGVFDSSSLIYLKKCGLLEQALETLEGVIIPEVAEETGFLFPETTPSPGGKNTDDKIHALILARRLPLISEDLGLLKKADAAGLPYFNALMILALQIMRRRLSFPEEKKALEILEKTAHYSPGVLKYGKKVLEYIRELNWKKPADHAING